MADAMTLEDVRDWHRGCEQAANADGHTRAAAAHKQLADAIDAALKAKPVGFVLRSVAPPYDYWPESFVLREPQDDESETEHWEPLYTHPPAQPQNARDAWQPIETLSGAPDLVLAYVPPDEQFPTGRMMIWRRDILTRNVAGPTPDHLMYPATHWMPLPTPPATAREGNRDL